MELGELHKIRVPRRVLCDGAVEIQLIGFCDSSERAYGATIYCRSKDEEGNVTNALLCAKSRVAPVKTISLPRLELSGALLLAKLMRNVTDALDSKISKIFYFTDSTIVLNWINSEPVKWKPFIANRVSKIHALTNLSCWNHVRSKNNPADIVSRGMPVEQLMKSMWWNGPEFLSKEPAEWSTDYKVNREETEEARQQKTILVARRDENITERFSSLNKLQRVTAYCLRFYNNAKGNAKIHGPLTVKEVQDALERVIKICQEDAFKDDINILKHEGRVRRTSKLLSLTPMLDDKQILRVGGRLKYGDFDYEKKHPIILPKNHALTTLIVRHEHQRNFHAGAQATLAAIRERYWPISGKNTVKRIIRECIICFKHSPINHNRIMAPLPKDRITPSRPFTYTALDMAGPFLVKESKFRNKRILKAYACIFVCFASKAVHIEITTDLTCESFLNCLRRFTARRGLPKTLYSDNGKSFVAANKELKLAHKAFLDTANKNEMNSYMLDHNIDWKFMPPRAPHFGGLHEAAVKSMKKHLTRVTKNLVLTLEQLQTIMTRIEAILNSRPLYPSSDDPNDPSALTPGHFLIGCPLNALPDEVVQVPRAYKLTDYHKLINVILSFWERWSRDYLNYLQTRSKWKIDGQDGNIQPGDLVLIHEDNLPPQSWPMGRVLQLHPGPDGIVRVVTLKVQGGTTKRATNKLFMLPKDA